MEFFSLMMTRCASSKLISTPFTKGTVAISQLIFANDLIVFCRGSLNAAYNFKIFLSEFQRFSVLAVNWSKSAIFFSNCDDLLKFQLQEILQISGEISFQIFGDSNEL